MKIKAVSVPVRQLERIERVFVLYCFFVIIRTRAVVVTRLPRSDLFCCVLWLLLLLVSYFFQTHLGYKVGYL